VVEQLKLQPIIVLSNPAGGYNRRVGLQEIDALAKAHKLPHVKATTPQEIEQSLTALAAVAPEFLIVNGGDGTVDMVLRLLLNHNPFPEFPSLLLLKGGTTNMTHRDCAPNGKPHKVLRCFLETLGSRQHVTCRRPLQVSCSGYEDTPLYGFFLGTGAIARIVRHVHEKKPQKASSYFLGELLILLSTLIRLVLRKDLQKDKLLKPSILIRDGEKKEHIFLAVSALKNLVAGIKTLASEESIGLIFMAADRKPRWSVADDLVLETSEPWILDGETFEAGRIFVKYAAPVTFVTSRRQR